MTLQSGGPRGRSVACFEATEGLSPAVVPHVIPLLASDEVSHDCIRALRSVAEERVGELIDALVDPNQPFASVGGWRGSSRCASPSAPPTVCCSVSTICDSKCGISADDRFWRSSRRTRRSASTKRASSRSSTARSPSTKYVWEKRRLLDGLEEGDDRSFLEELVRDRASQSLAHVFTLLALVLPTEPLRIAFRGLHTDDEGLRGTALEYLESVLAARYSRSVVAVSRGSAQAGQGSTAARGDARRPSALERVDQGKPRRTEEHAPPPLAGITRDGRSSKSRSANQLPVCRAQSISGIFGTSSRNSARALDLLL